MNWDSQRARVTCAPHFTVENDMLLTDRKSFQFTGLGEPEWYARDSRMPT
jgi:hypothetical protein